MEAAKRRITLARAAQQEYTQRRVIAPGNQLCINMNDFQGISVTCSCVCPEQMHTGFIPLSSLGPGFEVFRDGLEVLTQGRFYNVYSCYSRNVVRRPAS